MKNDDKAFPGGALQLTQCRLDQMYGRERKYWQGKPVLNQKQKNHLI